MCPFHIDTYQYIYFYILTIFLNAHFSFARIYFHFGSQCFWQNAFQIYTYTFVFFFISPCTFAVTKLFITLIIYVLMVCFCSRLGLHLPHPVASDSGKARWIASKFMLEVTLRLQREYDFLHQ